MLRLVPPITEELQDYEGEFDLLGLWKTKDGRLALITNLDDNGYLHGYVTRASRSYTCIWDGNQNSVSPFASIDDLLCKVN